MGDSGKRGLGDLVDDIAKVCVCWGGGGEVGEGIEKGG